MEMLPDRSGDDGIPWRATGVADDAAAGGMRPAVGPVGGVGDVVSDKRDGVTGGDMAVGGEWPSGTDAADSGAGAVVVAVFSPFPAGNKSAKGTMSKIIRERTYLETFVGRAPRETKPKACF